jgi:transposase
VTEKLYAALDVSLHKTAVCIMDHDGRIVREIGVMTCPDAIADVLRAYQDQLERLGLEAGPMSEWLVRGLVQHALDAVLMETVRRTRRCQP